MISDKRLADLQGALTKSGNSHDIEDVLSEVLSGHAQFWETEHATVVTQVADHETYRALNIWLAGGDLHEIISLLKDAEVWATDHGCSVIEVTGRRGWKKVLAPYGFVERAVVLSKDL